MNYRHLFPASLFMLVAVTAPANAAEHQTYTPALLAAAKAGGRPVLVDVKAWWCPVCHSQDRTIETKVKDNPRFSQLLILDLNYDKQKPEWKALGVRKQATLIAYRGPREIGRIEFRTDKEEIGRLLDGAVS